IPAIMIRPAVGSSEKVSGRISATPATGPRPGSTPIAVPANAPTKAASKLPGVAAMLNPYSRPWREFISSPLEQPLPEHAPGHLHFQKPHEEPFEADSDRDGVDRKPHDRPVGIIRQQPHAGREEQRGGYHIPDDGHHEEVERERGKQQEQPAQVGAGRQREGCRHGFVGAAMFFEHHGYRRNRQQGADGYRKNRRARLVPS